MEDVHYRRPSYGWNNDAFCQPLTAYIASIPCRQAWEDNRIAMRFANGYGVTILPVSQEEDIFEVLVLRFYETGSNDYQVAQYAPVPELNRGSFDEILDLCKQVALLPASKARPGASGRALQ